MTLKEFIGLQEELVLHFNGPKRRYLVDGKFGPKWLTLPKKVKLTEEESQLILSSLKNVANWEQDQAALADESKQSPGEET